MFLRFHTVFLSLFRIHLLFSHRIVDDSANANMLGCNNLIRRAILQQIGIMRDYHTYLASLKIKRLPHTCTGVYLTFGCGLDWLANPNTFTAPGMVFPARRAPPGALLLGCSGTRCNGMIHKMNKYAVAQKMITLTLETTLWRGAYAVSSWRGAGTGRGGTWKRRLKVLQFHSKLLHS